MGRVYCGLDCLRYHTPGHPESPERVGETSRRLERSGRVLLPPDRPIAVSEVGLAHGPSHLDNVTDGAYCDPDTPHYDGIESFALESASAALSAALACEGGENAFSLMRPPGHHAGRTRAAGFCYLNNVAIACSVLQAAKPSLRVGILDIDVHHGDGTQDIVLGRPGILFVSLHQSPLYPGTGLASEDNCLNFPLPPGTGEPAYLAALEKGLLALTDFRPDILAVSAGFDTFKDDPIARLRLEKASYRRVGALIAQAGLPRFGALEGGYSRDLPVLVENFLETFL